MRFLSGLDSLDILATAGVALLGYGLYLVSPPVALIVVGLILLLVALAIAGQRARKAKRG